MTLEVRERQRRCGALFYSQGAPFWLSFAGPLSPSSAILAPVTCNGSVSVQTASHNARVASTSPHMPPSPLELMKESPRERNTKQSQHNASAMKRSGCHLVLFHSRHCQCLGRWSFDRNACENATTYTFASPPLLASFTTSLTPKLLSMSHRPHDTQQCAKHMGNGHGDAAVSASSTTSRH